MFITQALDVEYVERRKKEAPYDGTDPENYADVYISPRSGSVFPIENETVFAYRPYFSVDKSVLKKGKSHVKMNKTPSRIQDAYIALDKKDFDSAFLQLFKKTQSLPTAKNMWAWNETTSRRTDEISSKTKAAASRKHEPTARSPLS